MNLIFNDETQDFFSLGLKLAPKQIVYIQVPDMFHELSDWEANETLSNNAFSVTKVDGSVNTFMIQAAYNASSGQIVLEGSGPEHFLQDDSANESLSFSINVIGSVNTIPTISLFEDHNDAPVEHCTKDGHCLQLFDDDNCTGATLGKGRLDG